ncbi:MAG: trypsin-like peptidase domain-containing protein [Xanthomonadales bacterium]|nr:trypsin-like peptidase domain-containing protein [Xanthomonadales bacterium]
MSRLFENLVYFGKFVLLGVIIAGAGLFVVTLQRNEPERSVDTPTGLEAVRTSFADAVDRAAPAVVNVYVDKVIEQRPVTILRDPQLRRFAGRAIFGKPRYLPRSELGSGVVVHGDGLILTNYHVVRGAEDIHIALWDGRIARATVVGYDEETDLAILSTELDGLATAPFAEYGRLRVGDVVLAIGNPFGLGQTVTMGIVSATGRADLQVSMYEDFIQTDAAINRGNSGGALINARGEIVGINTAMLEHEGGAEGIGFAIPISLAMDVLTQVIEHGQVIRGWLGVEMEDPRLVPDIAAQVGNVSGLVITGIYPQGPADRVGLQPGDFLTHFDGEPVGSLRELLKEIAAAPPGSEHTLRILREGEAVEETVTLIQRPPRLSGSG